MEYLFRVVLQDTETGAEAEMFTDLSREEALTYFEGNLPVIENYIGKPFVRRAVNIYGTPDGKHLAFIKKLHHEEGVSKISVLADQ